MKWKKLVFVKMWQRAIKTDKKKQNENIRAVMQWGNCKPASFLKLIHDTSRKCHFRHIFLYCTNPNNRQYLQNNSGQTCAFIRICRFYPKKCFISRARFGWKLCFCLQSHLNHITDKFNGGDFRMAGRYRTQLQFSVWSC